MRRSLAPILVLLAACAGSTPNPAAGPAEPRTVIGSENDVRVDAQIFADTLRPNVTIPIQYDITNRRPATILVADLIPQATYDPETQVVTVDIGTDVPGESFLPRLVSIPSGVRRSFKGAAHVYIRAMSPLTPAPKALRLRLNFLGVAQPFEKLIDIPEHAVHDPQLAAALFPKWVEGNETILTNDLPMRWMVGSAPEQDDASSPGRRRPF